MGPLESTRVQYYTNNEGLLAKTAYDEYKNETCLDHHGCSYTDYIIHIIDKLSSLADLAEQNFETRSLEVRAECCDLQVISFDFDRSCNVSRVDHANSTSHDSNGHPRYDTVRDYYIPSKTWYLA